MTSTPDLSAGARLETDGSAGLVRVFTLAGLADAASFRSFGGSIGGHGRDERVDEDGGGALVDGS